MSLRTSCTAQRKDAPSQSGTIRLMCQVLLMALCLPRQFAWMQNIVLDCITICIISTAIQKELLLKSRQISFLNIMLYYICLISSFCICFFSEVTGQFYSLETAERFTFLSGINGPSCYQFVEYLINLHKPRSQVQNITLQLSQAL